MNANRYSCSGHLLSALAGVVAWTLVNAPATCKALDPIAEAVPSTVNSGGATSYSFVVRYSDDGAVNYSTLDHRDVRVTGPGGFSVLAQFLGGQPAVSASYIEATYAIVPPGGSWDAADNGGYIVAMQSRQVYDMLNNPVRSGTIGQFTVNISDAPPPPAQPAQLLNVSTRLRVQSGQNAMIGGFIITGDAPKRVIVRGIGPSLANAGVAGALADPTIELNGAGGAIGSNDNWRDSQQPDIEASGIAPSDDRESAIIATLPPGSYTAVVLGKNGMTGIGLVEVYDLDQPVDAKLANISTRGFVETGSNVMIGGFILGKGPAPSRIVVRAIGPSLAESGISDVLADPTLELRDAHGELVRSNNNWRESQQGEIDATGVPPRNDLESAIVVTLAAAPYTALVSGVNGTTGVALVEVYQIQ